ncbi:MAG: hypothetical protein VKK59_03030 [Vampirovibrionales bacterium]|nr:hypothetical protein [Vampirovibrionales bacterium]
MSSSKPPISRFPPSKTTKITYGRFPQAAQRGAASEFSVALLIQRAYRVLASGSSQIFTSFTIGRILAVVGAIGLLLMPFLYGIRVQMETYLRTLGEKTQAQETDNQIKQVLLSRLESFQASRQLEKEFPNLHHNPDVLVIPVKVPKPAQKSFAQQMMQFWFGSTSEQPKQSTYLYDHTVTSNQY